MEHHKAEEHLKADACAVHCMDLRIQETVDKLIREQGLQFGKFDRVSIVGGASPRNETMASLGTSVKLHSPDRLILTAHEDCGAGTTLDDLRDMLKKVREAFPDRQVSAFWVKLDGAWSEVS